MRIGIDFDNTIACYDDVFYLCALEKNLIPENIEKNKGSIRDYLRSIGLEEEWIKLQGYIYGTRMELAKPFEGIENFLKFAYDNNIEIFIISHKTLHPYRGPKYDLHKSAKKWLKDIIFKNIEFPTYFELTLQKKLNRIKDLKCDFFIDDLPELLLEKNFPQKSRKILFDPQNRHPTNPNYVKFTSWNKLLNHFISLL